MGCILIPNKTILQFIMNKRDVQINILACNFSVQKNFELYI